MTKFLRQTALSLGLSLSAVLCSSASLYAAPPAIAFGELPVAHDADISPDGTHLAMIVNIKGTYYAATKKTEKSNEKMQAVVLGKELRPKYVSSYLYTKELGAKKGKILVKPKVFRQFNDRVVDWLEDDPDHILMQYSEEDFGEYPDVYKVNVATGKDKRVQRHHRGIESWLTDGGRLKVVLNG